MSRRIFYDGLNLALPQGTGIATYTRTLTQVVRGLGYEVGVVYAAPQTPPKDALLREVAFFDARRLPRIPLPQQAAADLLDYPRYYRSVPAVPVALQGVVLARQFEDTLPVHDYVFATRNLFGNCRRHFAHTHAFTRLALDPAPDIFHCTYQLPLRATAGCNIYTIHDLVPLRLPFTTLDNKRLMVRLLRKIARKADHIVTVSENSKRDIMELLGVEERRITNTYEAVYFPAKYRNLPDAVIAERLAGSFGLGFREYLLFFGALEPKKNVARLVEAYLSSGVEIPLVLVTGNGWANEAETRLLAELNQNHPANGRSRRRATRSVHRFEYVGFSTLVTLIRGARAVVFPSLYEGFGLPVLEAMVLGTPVVASRESSVPEVAGEAALLVDPYSTEEIAAAIRTVVNDSDLRTELVARGLVQAEKFSVERYRERVAALYRALA